MTRLFRPLARRWFGSRPTTVVECRRCGTTLDIGVDTCLHCESDRVVRYDIG
jgi:ribosomal protein L37E